MTNENDKNIPTFDLDLPVDGDVETLLSEILGTPPTASEDDKLSDTDSEAKLIVNFK